jgi:hypothetical protein
MDDQVLATRIEMLEDEICLRGTRLNARIHEVERLVERLAAETHESLCSGGRPGIDVRTAKVMDMFEEVVRAVDVRSIRHEADELTTMKAVADAMHSELTGRRTSEPALAQVA